MVASIGTNAGKCGSVTTSVPCHVGMSKLWQSATAGMPPIRTSIGIDDGKPLVVLLPKY